MNSAINKTKERIPIPELSTERAEYELARWSQVTITHNYGAEPPLSLILALLLYKVERDGPQRDGYQKNPLNKELRAFFTQVRLRRVIEAVISGEARKEVRAALQEELNRTGVGSLRMGTMPIHYFHRAYIKTRLLQCYDPRDLEILCQRREVAPTYGANLYESMAIDLNELLELPLRDPFHERRHDYCHEGPYPVAIGEQRRLLKDSFKKENPN